MTTELTVTDLAKTVRRDVRAATKDAADALHGLTISVRVDRASMMQSVDVTVKGMPESEIVLPDRAHGQPWATDRARAISTRLHDLAAPALAWANGRSRFCEISFDGLMAPRP